MRASCSCRAILPAPEGEGVAWRTTTLPTRAFLASHRSFRGWESHEELKEAEPVVLRDIARVLAGRLRDSNLLLGAR
jgi:hypothetical protein